MNKQCQAKDCKEWPDDGDWVKVGNRTLCKDCVVNDSKAAKVYVLVTTSYSDEAGKEAATIVQELEDSKFGLQMENERLTEENGRLGYAIESMQNGLVKARMENNNDKKRLHKNMSALINMVENDVDDMQTIANCIVAIVDTGGHYERKAPRKPLGNL